MDMYQKRKIRAEKKNNDSQKSFPSVGINWYPGHMLKTKKQIIEDLKLIDVIVEILDARIPVASQNPDIKQITQNKKKVIILNKSDLADEKETIKWVEYLKSQGITAIPTDSNLGKGTKETLKAIYDKVKQEMEKAASKGRINKNIRIMIVGIPNVGKSSFINRIINKKSAEVGNKPGVTKQKQWLRISNNIELLDTPGVLWPKFESKDVAYKLAYVGAIKDELINKDEIAYNLLNFLEVNNKNELFERYKLTESEINSIIPKEDKILEIMNIIARKRGAIVSGGEIDYEKVSSIILNDFRTGKIGRITLEKVNG